ncbi:hypothetical protein [Streptomyces sp. NPDC101150]|uniref:hypothetical protein n=1 Tax=Streptomyces sp. NPDC101150 TaxID=3366114 RepID=UPI0038015362
MFEVGFGKTAALSCAGATAAATAEQAANQKGVVHRSGQDRSRPVSAADLMPCVPASGDSAPAHDVETLTRFTAAVKRWKPINVAHVLDDVGNALDEVPPAEKDLADLVDRLQDSLTQLSNIALANGAVRVCDSIAALVERGRTLRATEAADREGVQVARRIGLIAKAALKMIRTASGRCQRRRLPHTSRLMSAA